MDEKISKLENIKSYLNSEKSIKSVYIFKEIFSFLDKKTLFNIINYNKQWQNALKINIENYKKLSGKYKIGKKYGRGKVYKLNTNILLFEGEYLNGKKNGNGKEYYYKSKLIFDWEYLNGEKTGKGKEYSYNGKLEYEGEYLNGERNEIGKEYYYNNKLKFEGEYLNGKIWI